MLWLTCELISACSQLHCVEPFASEQREQAGSTGRNHASPPRHRILPAQAAPRSRLCPGAGSVSARSAPNYCRRAYTEVASAGGPLLLQQTRGCPEKNREPRELSRGCGNSHRSGGPVSTTVYIPFHLQRVGRGSPALWPACKVLQCVVLGHTAKPISSPKGASRINRALLYTLASPPGAVPA